MVKKTAKKTAKKATKKTAKKARAPRAKKEGLRKPQVRILAALARNKKPLTRAEIAEKAPCDLAMLNSYIGAHDDVVRAKNDKKIAISLRTRKFVEVAQREEDGKVEHKITVLGRKALKAANEE